ncbi:hypothetical protein EW026_g5755 [Hermanssonia centrifuga]|uniref:C2H2-type domain-containing protein n=1 Tax=Hermanssonia centrifuga TaxID=98765 RepID=A0A4S4KHI3_9APHY|nr:hypothetical protein EW026_g5755 [Hermanssonia centrifuga]
MLSLPSSSRVSSTTNCASIDTEDIEMSDDGSEPDDGSKVSDYEDDSDYDDDYDDDDDDDYAAGSSTRKRARAKAIQPRRQVNRKQRRTSVDAQRDEDTLGGAGDLGDEDAEGDDEEDDAGPPRKRAKPSVRSPDPAPVKKQPPRKRKKASNTTKKSRFSCPLCGTTVGRESDLGRHQRESCRKGAKPPSGYVCPHEGCGNVLSRADALKRHVESVHGAEA